MPRVLIQLVVNVFSADLLVNYNMALFERIRNRLANVVNDWVGSEYSDYLYSKCENEVREVVGDKEEEGEEAADANNVFIPMAESTDDAKEDEQLSNLFVQITFSGVTV
jgi:predicted house-cleaning noncanonical NTP pyrophosphatase (MazG superfamily)